MLDKILNSWQYISRMIMFGNLFWFVILLFAISPIAFVFLGFAATWNLVDVRIQQLILYLSGKDDAFQYEESDSNKK